MVKRSTPISSYYFGPLSVDSAYFTPPMGQIGVHQLPEVVWGRIIQLYKLCAPDVVHTAWIVFVYQLLAQQAGNNSNKHIVCFINSIYF